MQHVKDNRVINYKLVIDDKYPFLSEIKGGVLYLNVPKKFDMYTVNRFLDRQFDHLYSMINDREYKKFYGKTVVHYLGKTYFAKTKKSDKDEMIIKGDTLTIYCKNDTISQHKAIYRRYLKRAVEQTIVKLYYDAENDFKEIVMPKIFVKSPGRNAWGINMGDEVYMSPWLGRFDEIYIKLVLYHELCHCLISDHSDSFYALLDRKLSNGTALEKKFDEIVYVDKF